MRHHRPDRSRRPSLLAGLALALGLLAGAPAEAQRIIAVVNDDVVTDRDVRQRVRLALLATGQRPDEGTVARLRPQVLRTLVDERLQLQEAERFGIAVEDAEVEAALDRIAANNDIPRERLMRSLEQAGVSPATLRRQVRAELAWRRVVQRRLVPRVVVSDVQIAQRLKEINAGEPQFRLAEIFLPIYDAADEQRVVQDALELRQSLDDGADFAALARQFSAAPSAERGGDRGWLAAGSIPEELRGLVRQLPDGGVTRPLRTREGVYLFRRLGVRDSAVSELGVSLLRLEVAGDRVDGTGVAAFATETRAESASCGELRGAVGGVDGLRIEQLDGVAPDQLEGRIATLALTLPVGVLSEPLPTADGGNALIMVCERTGGAGPEQRAQVEEQLRGEALERLANRYLRNLRRDAFIELRLGQG